MFKDIPDSTAQARLHDLARAEAVRLRREEIEAFWKAMRNSTNRSAQRLAYRLARHRKGREDASATTTHGV